MEFLDRSKSKAKNSNQGTSKYNINNPLQVAMTYLPNQRCLADYILGLSEAADLDNFSQSLWEDAAKALRNMRVYTTPTICKQAWPFVDPKLNEWFNVNVPLTDVDPKSKCLYKEDWTKLSMRLAKVKAEMAMLPEVQLPLLFSNYVFYFVKYNNVLVEKAIVPGLQDLVLKFGGKIMFDVTCDHSLKDKDIFIAADDNNKLNLTFSHKLSGRLYQRDMIYDCIMLGNHVNEHLLLKYVWSPSTCTPPYATRRLLNTTELEFNRVLLNADGYLDALLGGSTLCQNYADEGRNEIAQTNHSMSKESLSTTFSMAFNHGGETDSCKPKRRKLHIIKPAHDKDGSSFDKSSAKQTTITQEDRRISNLAACLHVIPSVHASGHSNMMSLCRIAAYSILKMQKNGKMSTNELETATNRIKSFLQGLKRMDESARKEMLHSIQQLNPKINALELDELYKIITIVN